MIAISYELLVSIAASVCGFHRLGIEGSELNGTKFTSLGIARLRLPVTTAMRNVDELPARPVEQWIGFGPAFYGPGLRPPGPLLNQIPRQIRQQIIP